MTLNLSKENKSIDPKIFSTLNERQFDGVSKINGPTLVLAGAGSGKTRVLTYRIANLISQGVQPYKILALTFTNKAAREMTERIALLVGEQSAKSVWAGTFHSIFARILRYEATAIGYTPDYSIYDADDQLSAIKKIMNQEGISPQSFSPYQVRSRISNAKSNMLNPTEFMEEADNTFDKQVGLIYSGYEKYLRQSNAMDFDDILINMIRLLRSSRDILEKYQSKFKYILVDEYQDTNRAQYIAIRELSKAHNNICVVGDDAQSIYRWRGAEIKNILDFKKDYPNANVVKLEQNYRSTQNILDAADSVIKNNKNQLEKKLWTENPKGDLVVITAGDDERHEAELIAQKIKELTFQDFSNKDICILYRTNAQSLALESALKKERISYVVVGGISFFKRKEIKDVISYLRLLINRNDNESFDRIINEPPRGLGKTSLQHLYDYASQTGSSFLTSSGEADLVDQLQTRAQKSFKQFHYLIEKYSNKFEQEMNKSGILLEFIEATELPNMFKEIGTDESLDRWNNIQQLISDIGLFFRENEGVTLNDYLQQVALITDLDEAEIDNEQITMMTLHSAKGLEFPCVFVAGMEQGLFPLERTESILEEKEEERRLFYVGITRAKEKLFLSYAKRRSRFGETKYTTPSLFLHEIKPELVDWKAKKIEKKSVNDNVRNAFTSKPTINRPQRNDFDQTIEYSYSQVDETLTDYKIGDKVSHSKFGRGTITGLKGIADKRQAVIRFDDFGKKALMLKYANLHRLNS
jgi:DNA helicase-2/ATP-dependent DNA helicase PcrA